MTRSKNVAHYDLVLCFSSDKEEHGKTVNDSNHGADQTNEKAMPLDSSLICFRNVLPNMQMAFLVHMNLMRNRGMRD